MKPFCEVVTTSVLPSIRSIMTRELMTTYNMTQQEIADTLGLTQPAVSQYKRQSRGSKVKILEEEKEILDMIKVLTKDIVDKRVNTRQVNQRFCQVCKKIREKKLICKLHEEICPSIAPCHNCESC
jgi:predicted transcriptional regulator